MLVPVDAEPSFLAADTHQPTLELLKQTLAGQDSFPNLQTAFSNDSRTKSLSPFWKRSRHQGGGPRPARRAGVRIRAGEVTAATRIPAGRDRLV